MNSTDGLQEVFTQLKLPFDQWFINLHDYKRKKQRTKIKHRHVDQVVQKKTGKKYSIHISTKKYKGLKLHENTNFSRNLHLTISFNHRSILKFYGLNPIGYKKENKPVILTEFTPYGLLSDFLDNERKADKPNLLWNSAKKLINIYDIACAIRYLHSKNIIYLYLSPDSILLDDLLYPKLFDFGRCADLDEGYDNIKNKHTSRYTAPEILFNAEYTKKSDTYSFSLIIYRIITDEEPFQFPHDRDFLQFIKEGYRPKFDKIIPDFYKELIEKCWSEEPDDRPSFDEIVEILKKPDESFFNSKDEFDEYKRHVISDDEKQKEEDININKYEMFLKISEKDNYSTYVLSKNQTRKLFTGKIYSKGEEELPYEYDKKVSLYKILLDFDHPSLLKYIGYSLFDLQSRPFLTIISEFAQDSLDKSLRLNKQSDWLTPTQVLINIFGIVSGMKYLHSHGYIHCNLSTETILEDDDHYPKITDFEKMEKILDDPYQQSKTSTFITKYSAPEVIKTGNYSKCSDVYSFAYILYELITNKKTFEEFDSETEIIEAISNGFRPEIPSSVPKCYRDLIKSCWSEDPDLRPSFHQISRKLEFKEDFIFKNVDHVEFQNYLEKVGQHLNKELYNKFQNKISDINRINIDKYEKLDNIGKNKNANICIAREISTGKILQAEILFKEIEEFNEDEIDHLALEVKILDKLKHKAIISFIGFSIIDFQKFDRPVILTEIVKNGTLHDYIEQEAFLNNSDSDWTAVKKLINIYGIALAMSQLHKNNIINLNLKSENILLDQLLYPKLSDFKICFDISDKNDDRANCMKKSDVYSFGLIVYEILTNKVPYEDDSTLTTNSHFDLLLGNEIPLCFKILIEKCLKQVPFDRPSFEDIISTLKTQEFITFLNSEDQKEEYFNYIYSIESENEVCTLINIYKYQMISKICDKFNSEIFKIQEKSTKKYFAAKAFTKEKEELPDEYEKQKNVHKILLNLDHPSLLKYIGYSPFNYEYKPLLTTINEYAQCSLFDVLEKKEEIEGWSSTKKLINIYGIASAMNYLHSNGFIHRNLSTDNILEDENFYPKITGFNEIASIFQLNVNNAFFDYPKYTAPEVIKSKEYSKASDVYAFSIILYELVTGKKPFAEFKSDFHVQDAVCKGYRPEIPKSVPSVYKVLIESCWSQDPDCRPTFSQVVDYFETEEDFIFYDAERDEFEAFINLLNSQKDLEKEEQNSSEIKSININDFERLERIGFGTFAKVFKVKEEKTGNIYAAKVIKSDSDKLSEDEKNCFKREIKIMFLLNHPAILKIHGFSPVNFSHKPQSTIIMEYESNGCLEDIMELERKGNSLRGWDSTKMHINIYGIALGMEYMHSLNIIHRDLKPANILEDVYLFPKICDFGLSKQLHQNPDSMTLISKQGPKGTPAYSAPEVILKEINTKASDVYSFGVMVYEMVSKKKMYEANQFQLMMNYVRKGKRPEFEPSFPKNYKILVEKCWAQNPDDRPSFSDIVQILKKDEFLEGIDKKSFLEYVEYCQYSNIKNYSKNFQKVETNLEIKKEVRDEVILPKVPIIDLLNFDRKEKIGFGGFGKVFKIVNKSGNEIFAAKILNKQLVDFEEKDLINFKREIENISKVKHEAIMQFIGYSSENFKHKKKPVIVTELVPNGSLASVLLNESKGYAIDGWDDTKKLINIYGVAAAMKYMHSKSFLHRDLKTENILLDNHLYPKLSDFGLSKVFSPKVCETNSGILGTPPYIAPEILKYNEYSKASDVYAYSLVVYEIMTNEKPFIELVNANNIWINVANNHYRPKFKTPIPKCYQDLIEICWSDDPFERPSFDEIIETIKSNPEFITENIDYDEFIDYAEFIGENYLPEDQNIQNQQENKEKVSRKVIDISKDNAQEKINEQTLTTFNRIVEEEMSNQSINNYFLDLNDYELKNLIRRGEFSKVFEVTHKETGKSYSARLSNIDMTLFKEEEMTNISLEFNRISQLNHPAILQFVGFCPHSFKNEPKPVVVTELSSNKTLSDVLQMDRNNIRVSGWNATKKLMNIYGIASAMKYLHSHDIIHRNLKPNNIIMCNSCQPKLTDFGLCTHLLMINSMTFQTSSVMQETPVYSAPEIMISEECTKASDVYAFAMITYEIITKEKANIKSNVLSNIISGVLNYGKRPEFRNPIPDCYRNLIEAGWSQNPDERPSFDQIVDVLENVPEFITEEVNKQQYLDYIKMIKSTI